MSASGDQGAAPCAAPRGEFTATHWSVVVQAAAGSGPALETLCRTYWYPLYAYVRRRGHEVEDAEDLTQAFFARLLEKNSLVRVDREKGRFRSFLLMALNRFLINDWHQARTAKRGGGACPIPLEGGAAERRYRLEPASTETPETVYERRWVLAVLDQALVRLRQECEADGKGALFDGLKEFMSRDPDRGEYGAAAARLGMTGEAVAVAAHRLRRRYGELVRQEIAHTVSGPAELEEEMRWVFSTLSL
jgi:DNA-directed RNA polymerase specialized sigma24 family protein